MGNPIRGTKCPGDGPKHRGVKGINLRGDDIVVDMVVTNEEASLLTVCQMGYGKRTQVSEYRKTNRGGKGVINIKTTDRNGKVVALKSVIDTDELMVISAKGTVLRTDLSAVREIGRATQGVRLIRVDTGNQVVAVAKIVRENNGLNGNGGNGDSDGSQDNEWGSEPASASDTAADVGAADSEPPGTDGDNSAAEEPDPGQPPQV